MLSLSSPGLKLLLFALVLPYMTNGQTIQKHLCDGEQFRSILSDVDLASCLAETGETVSSSNRECSVMRHFENLSKERGQSLDEFIGGATVLIFVHSEFAKEITEPGNPVLQLAEDLSDHNAFIAVTKCLKAPNSTCQTLRFACFGGFTSHFVFMVSGHCSRSWGCAPFYSSDKSDPATVLNVLPYIRYRLLERQAFIAKERGELQMSTTTTVEYLIQTELNDTYGSQLVAKDSRPVALFVAEPSKTLVHYEQLSGFLYAAIRLRRFFAFHVALTPLSNIATESDRPLYRWMFEDGQGFMALYTKTLCDAKPTWAFSCRPYVIKGNEMLLQKQYTSFLLHKALSERALGGTPYPALSAADDLLSKFIQESDSFVVAVVPVEEMLTDPMVKWDALQSLTSYLGSSFGITYYSIIVSKSVALKVLKDLNSGLDLERTFYQPCFFIRFPTGSFAVLKIDEPIAVLDKMVRDEAQKSSYQVSLQVNQEMFTSPTQNVLPTKMTQLGHIVGALSVTSDEDSSDLVQEVRIPNATDAFVEQMKFDDIFNVTDVLVVESNPALMRDFFTKLGQDKPWLVLFAVTWSPLCKAARAVWSSVGQCARRLGFPDVQLVKVDCYEANEICRRLNITTYPTVSMFSRGIQLNAYSGPITSGHLCLYAKLAFESPVLSSNSEKETEEILVKLHQLKSRAFVLRGPEVPIQLTAIAKSLRFQEIFMHEKATSEMAPQLTAVYEDVRPSVSRYTGPLDNSESLLNFVLDGHLNSVFPCTWTYLPQALKLERPLTILFHVGAEDNHAALLEHLHVRLSNRTALCHLNLRKFVHLHDMVQQLAGLSLPSLVVLAKPAGSVGRVSYRKPLGMLPSDELPHQAVDWLDKALDHRLPDSSPLEPPQKWQPASRVLNFVDQIYHGKEDDLEAHRSHSSRAFTFDSSQNKMMDGDEDEAGGGGPANKAMVSPESPMTGLGEGKSVSSSIRDEL